MPTFQYVAETRSGERLVGTLSAADEATARRDLAAQGLTVLELTRQAVSEPEVDERVVLVEDELVALVDTVGAAAAGRVPVEVALAALAEDAESPRLAEVARQLSLQLAQGESIDQAVKLLEHKLPAEIRGVLQAGVESGDLAGTVERFAHERVASQRIGRRIRAALAYPLLILAIFIPLAMFLCLYVIPMFGDIYDDFALELPAMTKLTLRTAKVLPGVIVVLLLVVFGLQLVFRLVGGRWLVHWLRSATPLLGRLWVWSGQREFAAMLASFLELRLPMPSAIAHTGEVLGDRNLARACRRMHVPLQSGQPLSRSLSLSNRFDRGLVALVAWGEQYGLLPQALRMASEVFDDRIQQRISFVRRLIPPATLVAVATLVLLVVISLMIPLVRLIEGLSG